MPTVQVKDLEVLAVYVTDLERAKAFYRDMLGFVEEDEMPPGFLLRGGGTPLYLEGGCRSGRPGEVETAVCCPCFAVEGGVKAAAEALEKAGVTLVTPYTEYASTFGMFRVADPDGNVLEFAGEP